MQRLNKVIKTNDTETIIGLLSFSATIVKSAAYAYYNLFNKNMVEAIDIQLSPYHEDRIIIEYLLTKAGFDTSRSIKTLWQTLQIFGGR